MTRIRVVTQLLSVCTVLLVSALAPVLARASTQPFGPRIGPEELSGPWQIPNLLQQIVEAVRKAVQEVEEDLRRQLCSRCPISMGAVVVALLLAIGKDVAWRR
jgi:hypothetical protein